MSDPQFDSATGDLLMQAGEKISKLREELATERARADAAEARIEQLEDGYDILKGQAGKLKRANDKAEADADAKRYRWLRSWTRVGHWSVSRWRVGEGRYEPVPQEAKMDAAIDKAMKDDTAA